jgi:hypothetical protein
MAAATQPHFQLNARAEIETARGLGAVDRLALRPRNLEQNMKSKWNSLVVGSCNVFGLALLALSATAGGSAVRAGDPSTLQSIVSEPLTRIVQGIEQRVADLEASVAALADSFTAKRIVAQQLCVADGSGAQTCITKAQLDALLKTAVQAGQTAAAIEPGVTEQTPSSEKSAVAEVAAAMPSETPPAIEPTDAVVNATVAIPEGATAMPSETQPTGGQPIAAASEAGAPLPEEATVQPPATEPAETVIAANAKPETLVAVERPAKDEEPAHTGSMETNLAAPELKAAPEETPQVSERQE